MHTYIHAYLHTDSKARLATELDGLKTDTDRRRMCKKSKTERH